MFMIVNKMYLKQLQTNQEEEIIDCRKSKMEKHCVKPQILDHSNKVLTSKDFKRSTLGSLLSYLELFLVMLLALVCSYICIV